MKPEIKYDCAIIGGGLGGLTLSIQLTKLNYSVILFEKETYPFHKVCGEYISMESFNFLDGLGLALNKMNLPIINQLIISSPSGTKFSCALPLGGFGISRYKIDNALKDIAERSGVAVMQGCKVEECNLADDYFTITTSAGTFFSRACCGCFGKRSNLDVKWKRPFITPVKKKPTNWIAVKYHVQTGFGADTIALHNFKNGYCGISKIEDEKYCLCYLTTAENLKKSNNSIVDMEEHILSVNPDLKKLFREIRKLYTPLSISQISFQKKTQVEKNVILSGDAAGLISPLCGNGMSMAMHAGKIAAAHLDDFLQGKTSRDEMEKSYQTEWRKSFSGRLTTGRVLQRLFGKKLLTNIFVRFLKAFPFIAKMLIKRTHGKPF